MKIKSRKKLNALPLVIAAGIIIIGVAAAYLLLNNAHRSPLSSSGSTPRPANSVDYGPPSQQDQHMADQQKEGIIKDQDSTTPTSSLRLNLIRANQSQSGQPLNIRALIEGATSGTCVATLTKSGSPTVKKEFSVSFEATTASCSGANIDVSEFAASGTWSLELYVKKDSSRSESVNTNVTIEK